MEYTMYVYIQLDKKLLIVATPIATSLATCCG